MTKYKTLVVIIGITLIIGMVSNTGFAQSNSGSNFLHVSVHASKQADYSIDSHFVVIPPIRKEIILDKLKDNGQLIDINIFGMLPESQDNGIIDAGKDAVKAEKGTGKDAGKDEVKAEKGEVKAEKDAGKDAAAAGKDEVKAEKDADTAAKIDDKDAKKDA